MSNTIKRRIFDAVVWSASLLFACGLLLDSALADELAVAGIGTSCPTEGGDLGEHAVRVPR
jgi:hypothetical protein